MCEKPPNVGLRDWTISLELPEYEPLSRLCQHLTFGLAGQLAPRRDSLGGTARGAHSIGETIPRPQPQAKAPAPPFDHASGQSEPRPTIGGALPSPPTPII